MYFVDKKIRKQNTKKVDKYQNVKTPTPLLGQSFSLYYLHFSFPPRVSLQQLNPITNTKTSCFLFFD